MIIKNIVFPVKAYWFLAAYLLLMAFAPIINIAFDDFTKNQSHFYVLVIIVLATIYYVICLNIIGSGYTVFQAIYMYIIGSSCRKRRESIRDCFNGPKKYLLLMGYSISAFVVGIISYSFIEHHEYQIAWKMFNYANPFIISGAVSLSIFFCVLPHDQLNSSKVFIKFS